MSPLDPNTMFEHAREALIQDECALSQAVFVDNFDELSLLHQTIEDLISREESKAVDHLAESADQLPEHRRSEYWADNHPYWWEHIIQPQFRGAFLITLMAAVELHLGHFARDAGTIVRAPIGPEDLKGGFYPRTRRYLALFCKITNPPEASWQRIGNYYAVRNSLVHEGSHTGDDKQARQITAFARSVQGLNVNSGRIELERVFCETALRDCRSFLEAVWKELVDLCRQAETERNR